MTAPAPLSGGDARTQLAEALASLWAADAGDTVDNVRSVNVFEETVALYVNALLPTVERIADERAAEAWDAGYSAAELDADEIPYSDRPERATWQPRQNPHRAASLRAASRGETGR